MLFCAFDDDIIQLTDAVCIMTAFTVEMLWWLQRGSGEQILKQADARDVGSGVWDHQSYHENTC